MYVGVTVNAKTGIAVKQMCASDANVWMSYGKEETKAVYLVPDSFSMPTVSPSCSINTAFLAKSIINKGKLVAKHTYL